MDKYSTRQVKPLNALKQLPEAKRRLVNKLIVSLHSNQLTEKSEKTINRTINRDRRVQSSGDTKQRRCNGYLIFYKEMFSLVKNEEGLGGDVTSIAKYVGKRWRALSDTRRHTYNEQARTLCSDGQQK